MHPPEYPLQPERKYSLVSPPPPVFSCSEIPPLFLCMSGFACFHNNNRSLCSLAPACRTNNLVLRVYLSRLSIGFSHDCGVSAGASTEDTAVRETALSIKGSDPTEKQIQPSRRKCVHNSSRLNSLAVAPARAYNSL